MDQAIRKPTFTTDRNGPLEDMAVVGAKQLDANDCYRSVRILTVRYEYQYLIRVRRSGRRQSGGACVGSRCMVCCLGCPQHAQYRGSGRRRTAVGLSHIPEIFNGARKL